MKTILATLTILAALQGKPVDLVPLADVGKAEGEFGWRGPAKGVLMVKANTPVKETLVFNLEAIAEEYDLTATIERLDKGTKSFHVGIITPGGTCSYEFDAFDATKCAVAMIDGQWGEMVDGPFFRKGKARTVTLEVRKAGLTVKADGRRFWSGKIDWTKTTTAQGIKLPDKNHLFLSATGDSWKVSGFALVPVK